MLYNYLFFNLTVEAVHVSKCNDLRYRIDTPRNFFHVDKFTGDILLMKPIQLSPMEQERNYDITVIATVGEHSDKTHVQAKVVPDLIKTTDKKTNFTIQCKRSVVDCWIVGDVIRPASKGHAYSDWGEWDAACPGKTSNISDAAVL